MLPSSHHVPGQDVRVILSIGQRDEAREVLGDLLKLHGGRCEAWFGGRVYKEKAIGIPTVMALYQL